MNKSGQRPIGKGRSSKTTKLVKKEIQVDDVSSNIPDISFGNTRDIPSVEIIRCISYQKFRYSGENRPGKKYQEKDFMTLKLNNLKDKVVRTLIICTDAENKELIHPNGLVGKDCHNGIYDKEYPVTKSSCTIKIPYLRTERIKTKKNEADKIQSVLQERATHLPSPYRERCLSQCTDKYTSSRRFDTTKVCLGVIVTVSHLGKINGSLHAISHVVRNASEKTSLGIIKLSQDAVPANTGAEIDIFTTEDGPLIEPDKWTVFVTCPLEDDRTWASLKSIPKKEDILYKHVIRYQVPPCEPNPQVPHDVEAILHLECPQSAQYINHPIVYLSADQSLPNFTVNLKRQYIQEPVEMKPCPKRLRLESGDGLEIDTIKANLKSKLKARQDVDLYTPNSGQAQDNETIIVNPHFNVYNSQQQVLVQHHNLDTSESSVLLDMDAARDSRTGNVIVEDENHHPIQHISLEQLKQDSSIKSLVNVSKGSEFQTGTQDVQVVAAGYSDALPPDSTLLIYTTNGGVPTEQVAIDGVTGDEYVMQEVPHDASMMIDGGVSYAKAISENGQSSQPLREINNARQVIAHKGMVSLVSRKQISQGIVISEHEQKSPDQRVVQSRDGIKFINMSTASQITSSPSRMFTGTTVTSSAGGISRILIPSKKAQASSPWAVNDEEEAAMTLSEISGIYSPVPKASASVESVNQDRSSIVEFKSPHIVLPRSGDESNIKQDHEGKESGNGLSSMGQLFVGNLLQRINASESGSGGLDSLVVAEFAQNFDETQPAGIPQSGIDSSKED